MIETENEQLESAVLSGESCIAVPIEILENSKGELSVLTYSFCRKTAEEFTAKFSEKPFSAEALAWIGEQLEGTMNELGYEHYSHEGELMLEYVLRDRKCLPAHGEKRAVAICDNAELERLCENTGCSIELNDSGDDVLFAVVENGVILSYAGINDVFYEDGSAEISVETSPDRRREGFGLECVTALCEHLLVLGKCIRYKSSIYNKASCALAEKCGFSLDAKRFSYICGRVQDN